MKKKMNFDRLLSNFTMILVLIFFSISPLFSQQKTAEVRDVIKAEEPVSVAAPTWNITHYGFLKTDYVYSSNAGLSYGREMLGAVNTAKRQLQADDTAGRGNIQLADTRYGMRLKFTDALLGIIELDLMDFDKSSPNVNTRPRIRQAYFSYNLSSWELFAGQRWDIFAPVNAESYNIVSSSFGNGNVGWMREQIGIGKKLTKELTFTTAIGNGGVNVNQYPTNGGELNKTPTVAFQIKYVPNPSNILYLSGITYSKQYVDPTLDSPIRGTDGTFTEKTLIDDGSSTYFALGTELGKTNRIRRNSTGISLGHEFKSNDNKLRVKWEATYGQNLGDINTLSIASGDQRTLARQFSTSQYGGLTSGVEGNPFYNTQDPLNYAPRSWANYYSKRTEVVSIAERSAFLSVVYKILPDWELGLFGGASQVINKEDLVPSSLGVSNFSIMQPNPPAGTSGGYWGNLTQGKIRESSDVGIHLTYFLGPVKIFFQHEYIRTFYKDSERTKGLNAYINSIDVDTGTITYNKIKMPYETASEQATTHVVRFGTQIPF
jgi:hypothetical protein